jgi:hypothetical protein
MTHFEMYLFTRLDTIFNASTIIFALSAILAVWLGAIMLIERSNYYPDDDTVAALKMAIKRTIGVAVISGTVALLVPTQKDLAAIYLVPKILNNESANEIADKTLDVLKLKLDEWALDLSPKKDSK